ncbi:OmpA family protein [Azospirillum sp. B4]|uniref:OmpA family protein n=1 Tax=Azospirillum sp. B4 TaxID=95605 RepID=UPI00131EEEBD|nr:OmpA family protein [Azospirillum sp. B4]
MSASPAVIAVTVAMLAMPAYAQSPAAQPDSAQQAPSDKTTGAKHKVTKPAPAPAVPGQSTDSQSGKATTPPASGDLGAPTIERAKPAPTPKVVPVPETPRSLLKPEATPTPDRAKEPEGASPPVTTDIRPRGVTHVEKGAPVTQAARVTVPFAAGSSALDKKQEAALAAIAGRLGQDPDRRLEIRGYAPLPALDREAAARRLSLFRATAVRDRLMALGVPKERLVIHAMGSVSGDQDDKEAVRNAGKGSNLPPESFDKVELAFIQ